jgi:hypothetical protein
MTETKLGGQFTFPGTSLTVHRMGYGAMQLAGPGVWGPPKDPDAAIAVLREAVAPGVNHIDTADFYGPHSTNQIIRQALHPYPKDLRPLREEERRSRLVRRTCPSGPRAHAARRRRGSDPKSSQVRSAALLETPVARKTPWVLLAERVPVAISVVGCSVPCWDSCW